MWVSLFKSLERLCVSGYGCKSLQEPRAALGGGVAKASQSEAPRPESRQPLSSQRNPAAAVAAAGDDRASRGVRRGHRGGPFTQGSDAMLWPGTPSPQQLWLKRKAAANTLPRSLCRRRDAAAWAAVPLTAPVSPFVPVSRFEQSCGEHPPAQAFTGRERPVTAPV